MRRLWWPEPLYEMKPHGALALGMLAALFGAARSWAMQDWDMSFVAALVFGGSGIIYAIAVFRMRYEHRRRSRWNRERRR